MENLIVNICFQTSSTTSSIVFLPMHKGIIRTTKDFTASLWLKVWVIQMRKYLL